MLELIDVCKRFGDQRVLQDVNLRFDAGERYAIMGPSGCGKTTLLSIAAGLILPDQGRVRSNRPLTFSAVFQENRLLEHLTATDNVRLVCRSQRQEIEALLARLGLEPDSLAKPVRAFSGGMKRRVALCRALMARYDVLLLDEPFKGLDADTREAVMALTRQITEGKTVLLVTHDPLEAGDFHRIWLSEGHVKTP